MTPFYVMAYSNCLTELMVYTLYTLRSCSHVNAVSAAVNLNILVTDKHTIAAWGCDTLSVSMHYAEGELVSCTLRKRAMNETFVCLYK